MHFISLLVLFIFLLVFLIQKKFYLLLINIRIFYISTIVIFCEYYLICNIIFLKIYTKYTNIIYYKNFLPI